MHRYGKLHTCAFLVAVIHTDITAKPTSKPLGDTQVELGVNRRILGFFKPIEDMIPAIFGNTGTRILNIVCQQVIAFITPAANPYFTLFRKDAGCSHQFTEHKFNDTGIRRNKEILTESPAEREFYTILEISEIGIDATLTEQVRTETIRAEFPALTVS